MHTKGLSTLCFAQIDVSQSKHNSRKKLFTSFELLAPLVNELPKSSVSPAYTDVLSDVPYV